MTSKHPGITAETLAQLEPLTSLSTARLQELTDLCVAQRLPAGTLLFKEGDTDGDTVYLLSGEVAIESRADDVNFRLRAPGADARHPVADKQPRRASVRATTDIDIVRFDNDLLDMMMTWDELADMQQPGNAPGATDAGLGANKSARAFQHLPPANFEKIRQRMQPVTFAAGDLVMKEGDAGDYYYLIESGKAKVSRQGAGGPMFLAELGPGDSLGEEALVSDNPRNATVTMATDGVLLRLDKNDFDILMREPMLNWIELPAARALVSAGKAKWLDVRTISEFRHARVTDAVFCPLRDLRRQIERLDRDQQYICYCKTGKRSSAAAYILNERGYKAHALKGGLQALPDSE